MSDTSTHEPWESPHETVDEPEHETLDEPAPETDATEKPKATRKKKKAE